MSYARAGARSRVVALLPVHDDHVNIGGLCRRKHLAERVFLASSRLDVRQTTEVRAVRSRLLFSKRASLPGGGIAMSGDIRGYGSRVETLYMHTGAGDMPERYQVYLDFV